VRGEHLIPGSITDAELAERSLLAGWELLAGLAPDECELPLAGRLVAPGRTRGEIRRILTGPARGARPWIDQAPPEPPRGVARSVSEARGFAPFARYAGRCLFDTACGYYATGRVASDGEWDYLTHPVGLSPVFAWMFAETIRPLLETISSRSAAAGEGPLTILELGGGDGILARDTLRYIGRQARSPAWGALAGRIRYVIGEKSPALCERQREVLRRHIEAGRAQVREIDAAELEWEGPFHGIVVANELLDALPCERLRIAGRGPLTRRLHVVPLAAGAQAAVWTCCISPRRWPGTGRRAPAADLSCSGTFVSARTAMGP
jgi:hypothetical protein